MHHEDFIDTIAIGGRNKIPMTIAYNIDLIVGSQRQTDIPYEPMDLPTHIFCMEVMIDTNKDMVTTRKVTPCTGDNSEGKTLGEVNNSQYYIGSH